MHTSIVYNERVTNNLSVKTSNAVAFVYRLLQGMSGQIVAEMAVAPVL